MAQEDKLRIVFMGTPHFAAAVLRTLAQWHGGEIVAVYTQPDRPAGRGQKLSPSPVKLAAQSLSVPVFQPQNFKNPEDIQMLADFRPDILAVAAYGLLLPEIVLAIPRLAALNVHASLLPAYRGAAPIQRAVIDGSAVSGISIMRMVLRLDAGPVYARHSLPIAGLTADDLYDALAEVGGNALCTVLDRIAAGTACAEAQDEAQASYAAKLSKQDGIIDWSQPAAAVHARILGVTSRPGAQVQILFGGCAAPADGLSGDSMRVPAAALLPENSAEALSLTVLPGCIEPARAVKNAGQEAGLVYLDADGLTISCADCRYRLTEVRPQGRKNMAVRDFVNGRLRGIPYGCVGRVVYA